MDFIVLVSNGRIYMKIEDYLSALNYYQQAFKMDAPTL